MSKQTAVDWLIDNLPQRFKNAMLLSSKEIIEQAKVIEREHIIDAYYQCGKDNFEHIKVINRSATDYYNETYGGK